MSVKEKVGTTVPHSPTPGSQASATNITTAGKNQENTRLKEKGMDFFVLSAWVIIFITITEWFSYYLQVMMNLFNLNLREFPPGDILVVFAAFFMPLVTLPLSIIGASRFRYRLLGVTRPGLVIALLVATTLFWLVHSAYFQLFDVFVPVYTDVTPNTEMVGVIGYLNPLVILLINAANVAVFFFLVPVAFNVATGGTSRLKISKEIVHAMIICGLYLAFRPGSIVDVPFREGIITGVLAMMLIIASTMGMTNRASKDNEIPGDWLLFDANAIPKWSYGGLAMIFAFSIAWPAIMGNGFPYRWWTWLGLASGATASLVLTRVTGKNSTSRIPPAGGIGLLLAILVLDIILSWSSLDALLLATLPVLEFILLALVGMSPILLAPLFSRQRDNKFLNHPARQLGFTFVATISLLLPFITVQLEPLTNLLGMLLIGVSGGLAIIAILVGNRKAR